jgi:DNA (cytosine-5)-methyltransferase 1
MNFVDICCGIGSFHYSLAKKGMKCVMACDIDPVARETYKANYQIEPRGDLYEIDPETLEHFDILCAGFPCQPFSNAGFHKGFDDTRGQLFFQIMKIARHHKPEYLLFENVPAIINHDGGNTLKTILSTMENDGYKVAYKRITCSDYGIPQMRKRVIIVGTRTTDPEKILDFDEFKKTSNLTEYLGKNFEKSIAYTIRCGGRRSPIHDKHNWDGYIVDGKEYRLTIEDALRLQGFPVDFVLKGSDTDKWHQLGNTIPTIFTEIIASNLTQ